MNRRGFITSLVGGLAATAAVRTFPFRVYSFPPEVVPAPSIAKYLHAAAESLLRDIEFDAYANGVCTFDQITAATLANLREDTLYDTSFYVDTPWLRKPRTMQTMNLDIEMVPA